VITLDTHMHTSPFLSEAQKNHCETHKLGSLPAHTLAHILTHMHVRTNKHC